MTSTADMGTNVGGAASESDPGAEALAAHVRLELERHGLEWEDLQQALRYQSARTGVSEASHDRIMKAAEAVVRDRRVPDDPEAFRAFVGEIEPLLGVEIDTSALDRPFMQALKKLPRVVGVVLFVVVTYVLFGSLIAAGQPPAACRPSASAAASATAAPTSTTPATAAPTSTTPAASCPPDKGLRAVGLFLFLLVLLAAVEALHISVTLLRLKDLNAVRDKFPRTFAAHKIFRHERGTERFLAGRQLFVIMTVFFAAPLTSFDKTADVAPGVGALGPQFRELFLTKGIAGALFLLWFGQLTPQFIANRRPLHFMNNWVISKLFSAALFIEAIGVTKPGGWIAGRVPAEQAIPVSAEERYRQVVEEIEGTGTVGVKKVWSISEQAAAKLSCDVSYRFARSGVPATHDESITVAGSVSGLKGAARLLADDGTDRELHAVGPTLERRDDGVASVVQTAQPRYGAFQEGDVLMLHTELEFARAAGLDRVSITEPTQYLLVRVELDGHPETIRGARVQGYEIGDAPTVDVMTGKRPILDQDLELMWNSEGTPCFEFTQWYPELNSHYFVTWEADYAMS
jgi:hypothetical protein